MRATSSIVITALMLMLAAAQTLEAESREPDRGASSHAQWPDCGGCGIDFDRVRSPLFEYAEALGLNGDYVEASSYLSSYNCPTEPAKNKFESIKWVRGQLVRWETEKTGEDITCLRLHETNHGGSSEDSVALSFEEATIFMAYIRWPFQPEASNESLQTGRQNCLRPAPQEPIDLGDERRRYLIHGDGMPSSLLLPCVDRHHGGEAQGSVGVRQRAIEPPPETQPVEGPAATWVSSRGNVLGIGDEVDVAGLLRGGAQRIHVVFGDHIVFDDAEDVDVSAMLESGVHTISRHIVGEGPWGELDFPHGRVCIVDLVDGLCDLAVRWASDQASSPVLRHVVTGETLGTGTSGDITVRLSAESSMQRIELIDNTSRILDRKTVKVVDSAGQLRQKESDTSSVHAGPPGDPLPDCGRCGIDFDAVREPLMEFAKRMGPAGEYNNVRGFLDSYSCPSRGGLNENNSKGYSVVVGREILTYREQRNSSNYIYCVGLQHADLSSHQGDLDRGDFVTLTSDEAVIFLAYRQYRNMITD